jgi:hypothetical protein
VIIVESGFLMMKLVWICCELMWIGMNLREFGWIVVLEKRLGFEGSSNLHRVLVKFLGLILFDSGERMELVFVELASSEWESPLH